MRMRYLVLMTAVMALLAVLGSGVSAANEQFVSVSVLAELFNVSSPLDLMIYNTEKIPVTIFANAKAKYIEFADNGLLIDKLCSNCKPLYNKTRRFGEGWHNVSINVVFDETNIRSRIIRFFVDSVRPGIKNNFLKSDFLDGNFSLEFVERNPQFVVVVYGNKDRGIRNASFSFNDCVSFPDDLFKCRKFVNVSEFDQMDVSYYFNVSDIANNSRVSKVIKSKVDFVSPNITSVDVKTSLRVAFFKARVVERNFEALYFIDESAKAPKYSRLCLRLNKDGLCEKMIPLSKGVHHVKFMAEDEAGNRGFFERDVEV